MQEQEQQCLTHSPTQQNNNKDPYICNYCHNKSHSPVVLHCGHIYWYIIFLVFYSWTCLSNIIESQYPYCRVCRIVVWVEEIRPVFISGEEGGSGGIGNIVTRRPKGVIKKPVENPSGLGNMSQNTQMLLNNIETNRRVAGSASLPSNFMLAFSSWQPTEHTTTDPLNDQISILSENMRPIPKNLQILQQVDKCASRLQKCLTVSILLVTAGILFLGSTI